MPKWRCRNKMLKCEEMQTKSKSSANYKLYITRCSKNSVSIYYVVFLRTIKDASSFRKSRSFSLTRLLAPTSRDCGLWKARDSIDYARIHDADHAGCCAHSRIFPDLTSRGSFRTKACPPLSLSLSSFDRTSFKSMTHRTRFISLSILCKHTVQGCVFRAYNKLNFYLFHISVCVITLIWAVDSIVRQQFL